MEEIWFEGAGARLFAVEVGPQPRASVGARAEDDAAPLPVILLHGGLADHRAALLRAGRLAEQRRLITPDLRGAGRSLYRGELSWDLLADDLAALLDHLRLERAVIGGTSMGSGVALRFALRYPRRAAALIVMSPLYPGEDRELAPAARQAMRAMHATAQRALVGGMQEFAPLFAQLPPPIRERAAAMMLGFDPASVAATASFLASEVQPMGSAAELAQLDAPALLLAGADPEHPAEVAELYARHLRRGRILDPLREDLADALADALGRLPSPRPV